MRAEIYLPLEQADRSKNLLQDGGFTAMVSEWKHIWAGLLALALACVLSCVSVPVAHADLGDRVSNIATISQSTETGRLTFQTNEAVFIIEARPTPSEIEFFRIVDNVPDAFMVQLNGSDFSPSGAEVGPFEPIVGVSRFGQKPLDTASPVSLIPAQTYLAGELMVVRVIDLGQNGDPNAIETVTIVVEADNGDMITLRLYEDGPNSGNFYAYFPSSAEPTAQNDLTLTTPQNTVLKATYIDIFDATEVSVDTALVDPFGRVFDSFTGELLDGVTVTVIDDTTGLPATVLGIDGGGAYPSAVVTGEQVTDGVGIVYDAAPGVFFYPVLPAGRYRLEVDAPEGYIYPSVRSQEEFEGLQNAPFRTELNASYGQVFTVSVSGPVNLDVPLDPNGDLIVRKEALAASASIGDFVGYTVELENSGDVPAPFSLRDTLPRGMRYVDGSARLEGSAVEDPEIDSTGRVLTFGGAFVLPGERIRLNYLVAVGPGTPTGEVTNEAVAVNQNGEALSNTAEAAIIIEEDLLASRLTIVGRIAEAACTPDDEWARKIIDGTGVPGVRIYMETGRYVVTDDNGLYHFEAIKPGTHVVQVDEATLPEGYEPVICEENTRYAGSALSKFVDATGGTIWRANFYLKRTAEALEAAVVVENQDRAVDEDAYDLSWLNAQMDAAPRWVYPETDQTPRGRSVNLGFVHAPKQQIELMLNGQPVSGLNFSGRELSEKRDVAISRWAGVDIQRGENRFIAILKDADGTEIDRFERFLWFVDEVDRARLVSDQSITPADGRTNPVIAIRLEDGDGHPMHEGRLVEISVADPYRLAGTSEEEFEAPVTASLSAVTGTRVGANGIAYVELEPTLESGRVRLSVPLENGDFEEIDVWLQPEKRDWVVVGLAEAEGLLSNLDGDASRDIDEVMSDGRLAFFAKGVVKGDWLLTLAVDTAKRRGGRDGEIFDEIDPSAYYTLYGDRTWQDNNAESRYPVYVKLEKDTFQAVFGDFETGLTRTELGRYSRRLSGLKVDYESEDASITAFAAETNQTFMKDEIAADGTSGPYRLDAAPLVRSSEVITIETRDRFRPDEILSTTVMNRYVDYEIDYVTGELFFRQPVAVTDDGFNPNVIVVDYETSELGDRGVTAGLRGAARFASGKLETGVTLVHEEDGATQGAEGSNLIAADVTLRLDASTEIRGEIAATNSQAETGQTSGEAVLLEAVRRTERMLVSGYFREETEGYGLGQQSSSTSALRRIGAQLSAELGVTDVEGGSDRSVSKLEAQAYREENLTEGSRRNVADITVGQASQGFGVNVGMRLVSESYDGLDETRQSILATAGVRKTFAEQGLTVIAAHEQPVWGGGDDDDEATLFPQRTSLGLNKTIGRRATLSVRHEITDGTNASGENTVAGITWAPLSGTELRAATDMITQDNARRIGATVGVDQTWQINQAWTVGTGLARRANVDDEEIPLDVTADDAVSPLEDGVRSALSESEAYSSGYFGVGYRSDKMAASGRVELRDSASGERLVATLGGAREITEKLSFSAIARHQNQALSDQGNREQTDVRIGSAWRSRGEGLIVLNRFDLGHSKDDTTGHRTKVVNNLAVNAMVTDRTQVSAYHGIKHVETNTNGAKAKGFTHLIGGEVRHDITPKIDVGLHGTWTSGEATKTSAWSFGPSIGFTPKENIWVSVGWNAEGFEDDDFEAARYTQQGPYIKLRAKFDQNTIKGLANQLGLGGR